MIKLIIIAVFLMIIFSLGSALYHLATHKNEGSSQKTAKALTVRIGLSMLLFLFVCILLVTGVIKPHGIGSRMHSQIPAIHQSTKWLKTSTTKFVHKKALSKRQRFFRYGVVCCYMM
jgi:O-antigen/teichoic acid export membrane protein